MSHRYLAAALFGLLLWGLPLGGMTYHISAPYLSLYGNVHYVMVHDTAGHVWHSERVRPDHKNTGKTLHFDVPRELEAHLFLTAVILHRQDDGHTSHVYISYFGLPDGYTLHTSKPEYPNPYCQYKIGISSLYRWADINYAKGSRWKADKNSENAGIWHIEQYCQSPLYLRFPTMADSAFHYYLADAPVMDDAKEAHLRLDTRQFSYCNTPLQMRTTDSLHSVFGYFQRSPSKGYVYLEGKMSGGRVVFPFPAEEDYSACKILASNVAKLDQDSYVSYSHRFRTRRLPDTYSLPHYPFNVTCADDLTTHITCDPAYTLASLVLITKIANTNYSWTINTPIHRTFTFRLPEVPAKIQKMDHTDLSIKAAFLQCDSLITKVDLYATERDVSLQDCPDMREFGDTEWLFDNNTVGTGYSHVKRRQLDGN